MTAVNRLGSRSRRPGRIDPKPTAKWSGSIGSSWMNGPTSDRGPQRPTVTPLTPDSSTSTITTDPTDHSSGPPQSTPSGTTSPHCTSSARSSPFHVSSSTCHVSVLRLASTHAWRACDETPSIHRCAHTGNAERTTWNLKRRAPASLRPSRRRGPSLRSSLRPPGSTGTRRLRRFRQASAS